MSVHRRWLLSIASRALLIMLKKLAQLISVAANARKDRLELQSIRVVRSASREREAARVLTTVFDSRSVRSAGTWRAKLRDCDSVFVRRAWSRIFEAVARALSGTWDHRRADRKNRGSPQADCLISCAAPAASCPRETSFSDCTIWACNRFRLRWTVPTEREAVSGRDPQDECAGRSATRAGRRQSRWPSDEITDCEIIMAEPQRINCKQGSEITPPSLAAPADTLV